MLMPLPVPPGVGLGLGRDMKYGLGQAVPYSSSASPKPGVKNEQSRLWMMTANPKRRR